jgi:hypothetical protein
MSRSSTCTTERILLIGDHDRQLQALSQVLPSPSRRRCQYFDAIADLAGRRTQRCWLSRRRLSVGRSRGRRGRPRGDARLLLSAAQP